MDKLSGKVANLDLLMDVPVKLTVELGSCHMQMREVLQLSLGSVVQLDKGAEAPVELYVNQKLLAWGEVVVVEDRLGIKITAIAGGGSNESGEEADEAESEPTPRTTAATSSSDS